MHELVKTVDLQAYTQKKPKTMGKPS